MYTVDGFGFLEPVRSKLEDSAIALVFKRRGIALEQLIYRDHEHADISWPLAPHRRLDTVVTTLDDIDLATGRHRNDSIAADFSTDFFEPFEQSMHERCLLVDAELVRLVHDEYERFVERKQMLQCVRLGTRQVTVADEQHNV